MREASESRGGSKEGAPSRNMVVRGLCPGNFFVILRANLYILMFCRHLGAKTYFRSLAPVFLLEGRSPLHSTTARCRYNVCEIKQ